MDRSDTAAATIEAIVPDGPAHAAALDLMAQSANADPAGRGFLLEVAGQDDTRRSIDVNLAHCDMSVGDAAASLAPALCETVGADVEEWLAAHEAERLGHFAAGHDADGAAFVTVYFGARPA